MPADLPADIADQIHPDRRANEQAYWAARDGLLAEYAGRWVGYADGRVVASGRSPVAVLAAAEATGLRPHLACVGREDEPDRVRRAAFPYDAGYPGEPLPVVSVEFRPAAGAAGFVLDRVIPDTGADVSVLPWADCLAVGMDPSHGQRGQIGGGRRYESGKPYHSWRGSGSTGETSRVGFRRTSRVTSASSGETC